MAKKSVIARQARREKLINKYFAKRQALIASGDREALLKLPRNSAPIRSRNRCQVTGRSGGYIRKFGLSRVTFREYASKGMIPGVKKSSW